MKKRHRQCNQPNSKVLVYIVRKTFTMESLQLLHVAVMERMVLTGSAAKLENDISFALKLPELVVDLRQALGPDVPVLPWWRFWQVLSFAVIVQANTTASDTFVWQAPPVLHLIDKGGLHWWLIIIIIAQWVIKCTQSQLHIRVRCRYIGWRIVFKCT